MLKPIKSNLGLNLGLILAAALTVAGSQAVAHSTDKSTDAATAKITDKIILPDAQGNYLSNLTNTLGNVLPDRKQDSPGSLWRVVAGNLNCRAMPHAEARSLRTFTRGTILQADIGRGGSDEVHINALDQHRKPWMLVRSRDGQPYQCYVRAHRKFIAPLP